jgi:hypothetical protein
LTGVRAPIAFPLALALSGCAIAPESKTFHLSARDFRGTELSAHGRPTIADAVAGAAPLTITRIEIGGLLGAPSDPEQRTRLQVKRAGAAVAALERSGIAAEAVGLEATPAEDIQREPSASSLEKRFDVVVHY